MQSRAPFDSKRPSSYCRLPTVEAFYSKRAPFTVCNTGKCCPQGILISHTSKTRHVKRIQMVVTVMLTIRVFLTFSDWQESNVTEL